MKDNFGFVTFLILASMLCASGIQAKVLVEEAALLGHNLTPFGSEKAGNAEGTIPAWNGGITQPPENFTPGDHHPDPFADDKVIFKINKANMANYANQLTEGHKALLNEDANYFLNIYLSRRTMSAPQRIYDATKKIAPLATLTKDGNGLLNAAEGTPFPIPGKGLEVIWNHLVRWRGNYVDRTCVYSPVTRGGAYNLGREQTETRFQYSLPGMTEDKMDNIILFVKHSILGPPRVAGRIILVHETLNQSVEARKAWVYFPGQRRVRRAPQLSFDTSDTGAEGVRTVDDYDLFNGSPERYEWKLAGKKEMYIPYNNYLLHSDTLKYKDIIQPLHLNPDYLRYELHRVWVVEANLKKEIRHLYKKRVFYVDEDSWSIVATDKYDRHDQLWRFGEGFLINYYDVPCTWFTAEVHYDLHTRRYLFNLLDNEERNTFIFDQEKPVRVFSAGALRRAGHR
ncbi:MAG TPA: DUF1329 domain-containing protein [Desulfarculaceae bacterium]|nr:DUF1329 domain-containing protein [Desulfarculaceae bacterium]